MIEAKVSLESISLDDVDIPASILNQAKNYLIQNDITKEGLKNLVKQSFHPVQALAYNYLSSLTDCVSKIQQIMQQRLDVEKARIKVKQVGSGYQFVYNQKKFKTLGLQLANQTTVVVKQTETFSEKLQQALGMKPVLAYTHMTKGHQTDIYIIDDISKITKIESKTTNVYNPRLRATLRGLQQYGRQVNKLQYISEHQLNYLDTAYSTVLHRFNKYTYDHTPSHLILWNMGSQGRADWYGMWMQQRGDIVESYQRAVFSRYEVFSGGVGVPENDINKFMEFVTQVDSASGLLQGDIETSDGLSVSSKMRGSEPQGITQAIQLAVQLINLMNNSEQSVMNYLKNKKQSLAAKGSLRNAIVQITKEEFQKIMAGQVAK